MGIEPTWPAWKAGALPLSYTRSCSDHFVADREKADREKAAGVTQHRVTSLSAGMGPSFDLLPTYRHPRGSPGTLGGAEKCAGARWTEGWLEVPRNGKKRRFPPVFPPPPAGVMPPWKV